MNNNKLLNYIVKVTSILVSLFLVIIIFIILKETIFFSDKTLINYIRKFGTFSVLIFIIVQMLQVVFPIIPGGASCLVGVILFGSFKGFIYNYIGLSIGSIIAFYLSRRYGLSLIRKVFSEKVIGKYEKYLNNKDYYKIFLWGILLPGAPDDLLCYLSGLTNITYKKFISIILACKPLTLFVYSIGWYYFPDFIELFI